MTSFASQDLLADGKFLTPVSGLHYVLHVFDQAEVVLSRLNLPEDHQLHLVQEQVRQNEDRVSYLEIKHTGLQQQVDNKVAETIR